MRTDTLGDTVVATTLAGAVLPEATLVEELRIGQLEGEAHEAFGAITALGVGLDGSILVYDGQSEALFRYAQDGRFLGRIGNAGSGPGEMRNVAGIAVLPDGRIVVHDFGNGRFNVYTADGQPLEHWPLRPAIAERRPLHGDGAGGVFLHDRFTSGETTTRTEILVRIGPDGRSGDTIRIPGADARPPGLEVRTERASIGALLPFAPMHAWSVTAAGELVTTTGSRYAIDVRKRDGTVLRIAREAEPVPVSAEERAAEEARITARFRRVVPGWRWDGPRVPDVKPPVLWLHTGDDGTIWVRVAAPGRALPEPEQLPTARSWVTEPLELDVFESDGRFVRRVHAPEGLRLLPYPVLRRDYVWAVVEDENGIDFVCRFRIVPD